MVLKTGFGAVWPSPHSDEDRMSLPRASSKSMSFDLPLPSVIRVRISRSRWVPIRHGTHLPHDSDLVNSRKYLAMFTMQLLLSRTIMPPEPTMEPTRVSDS